MKIRTDFVTNSSSSSFVISKKVLDAEQLEAIINHRQFAEEHNLTDYKYDDWDITVENGCVIGRTGMDNFDMEELLDAIEVDSEYVVWGDSYYNVNESDINRAKQLGRRYEKRYGTGLRNEEDR